MNKKFFISEDIKLILEGKSSFQNYFSNKGINVPSERKIKEIRSEMFDNLKNTYGDVEVLPEMEMYKSMKSLAKNSNYPLYSFDEIYLNGDKNVEDYLRLTRVKVGNKTMLTTRNSQGLYIPFKCEVKRIVADLRKNQDREADISLIDDVVFSGDLICNVASEFAKYGVNVREVLCAICVKEGFDKVKSMGIDIRAGNILDNVLDEVCERDFYFGLPQSGQNVLVDKDNCCKQPYFLPFGNPIERASVDEDKAKSFSRGCLECSQSLWGEMQNLSEKEILIGDLPEKIYNIKDENIGVVDLLRRSQEDLEQ